MPKTNPIIEKKARILIYDIETAPIIGTVWGKYEQNIIWNIQDWYMLCFAYKWAGERQTYVVGQNDFKGYKPGSDDDSHVIKKLHELFNEADVVVAHNGDSFDQKKSQARFIFHGLNPPSPYKQVDTKKVAKRYFNFTSNKLDDLGEHFKLGRKLKTNADLWRECMAGDEVAWGKMKRYNKQDVVLLEKIYIKMLPWMTNHPHPALYNDRPESCPKCGKGPMQSRGIQVNTTAKYRKWQCQSCGGWCRSRTQEKGLEKPHYVN